jgi:hypothetical protein
MRLSQNSTCEKNSRCWQPACSRSLAVKKGVRSGLWEVRAGYTARRSPHAAGQVLSAGLAEFGQEVNCESLPARAGCMNGAVWSQVGLRQRLAPLFFDLQSNIQVSEHFP